jgi:hypothetical protein
VQNGTSSSLNISGVQLHLPLFQTENAFIMLLRVHTTEITIYTANSRESQIAAFMPAWRCSPLSFLLARRISSSFLQNERSRQTDLIFAYPWPSSVFACPCSSTSDCLLASGSPEFLPPCVSCIFVATNITLDFIKSSSYMGEKDLAQDLFYSFLRRQTGVHLQHIYIKERNWDICF